MKLIMKNDKESGIVMVVCLILLLMLSLLGIASITTSNTEMDISGNEYNSTSAFYLADAGIERTIATLNDSTLWRGGFTEQALGNGSYTVQMLDSTSAPFLGDRLLIKSKGMVGTSVRELEVFLKPVTNPRWRYGVFGRDEVRVAGNGCIDSYDSDLGDYWSQVNGDHARENGHIGSGGDIRLNGGAQVYGNAQTSLAGGIQMGGSAVIHGDSTSQASIPEFPDVTNEEMNYAQTNNNASTGLSFDGRAEYNSATNELEARAGGTITFTSGVYYFSSVTLRSHAEIIIPAGEDVQIYVSGDWNSTGGSITNIGGTASSMQIFSSGGDFKFAGGPEGYATIYAPSSDITVTGGGEFYGAAIGKTFTNGGGTCFHFDEALTRDLAPTISGYTKESWTEN